jgi:hypothetical protein
MADLMIQPIDPEALLLILVHVRNFVYRDGTDAVSLTKYLLLTSHSALRQAPRYAMEEMLGNIVS